MLCALRAACCGCAVRAALRAAGCAARCRSPQQHTASPSPSSPWPNVDQVKANEPGTLSYELCQGDADPLKCLVYER